MEIADSYKKEEEEKRFNCCREEMSVEILIIFRVTTFAQHPMDPTHSYML